MDLNLFEIKLLEKLKDQKAVNATDLNFPQEVFDNTVRSLVKAGFLTGLPTEEDGYIHAELTKFGKRYILNI